MRISSMKKKQKKKICSIGRNSFNPAPSKCIADKWNSDKWITVNFLVDRILLSFYLDLIIITFYNYFYVYICLRIRFIENNRFITELDRFFNLNFYRFKKDKLKSKKERRKVYFEKESFKLYTCLQGVRTRNVV